MLKILSLPLFQNGRFLALNLVLLEEHFTARRKFSDRLKFKGENSGRVIATLPPSHRYDDYGPDHIENKPFSWIQGRTGKETSNGKIELRRTKTKGRTGRATVNREIAERVAAR